MVEKNLASVVFALALAALAVAPTLAQAAEARPRKETCLQVSLDGDYKFKIPCPRGLRPLLEKLPRPADPAPRRDTAIDPKWPHDQAMAAGHDWPHDSAMILPHADEEREAMPLFDELLGAIEGDVREGKVRQLLDDWRRQKPK